MTDSRISVRLDAATKRRLEQEIHATGTSESELVRAALAAYFQKHSPSPNCLELAEQEGLIGCAKRLPSDLSTNRKHREGFGK
jgi:hypothetical protein